MNWLLKAIRRPEPRIEIPILKRCDACRFWKYSGNYGGPECQRNAPIVDPAHPANPAVFPKTQGYDSCGQWEAWKRT